VPAEQPTIEPKPIDVDAAITSALQNRIDLAVIKKRLESIHDVMVKITRAEQKSAEVAEPAARADRNLGFASRPRYSR
jgi:hypothetical protein